MRAVGRPWTGADAQAVLTFDFLTVACVGVGALIGNAAAGLWLAIDLLLGTHTIEPEGGDEQTATKPETRR
ncbi:heme/copper-type cytochrome/quinol oxidase subunit 1 [Mesorhizobium soli]|nr:heme/copper-type cytochrome/quinol oxidase subunit 1 [Mesorhizobium soli]